VAWITDRYGPQEARRALQQETRQLGGFFTANSSSCRSATPPFSRLTHKPGGRCHDHPSSDLRLSIRLRFNSLHSTSFTADAHLCHGQTFEGTTTMARHGRYFQAVGVLRRASRNRAENPAFAIRTDKFVSFEYRAPSADRRSSARRHRGPGEFETVSTTARTAALR
jgi:hypothetical protein